MLCRVDESFLFIFDPSEVVKPYGKKMEGIALVRDASEKPRVIKDPVSGKFREMPVLRFGYPLRVAIALSPTGGILPLELSLYSARSEDFLSENDEYIQAISPLIHQTNFAPTLILDREFDAFSIIRHLCDLRQRFIIRVTSNRKYKLPSATKNLDEPNFTREEMAQKHDFLETETTITYSKNGSPQTKLFYFRAARVQLLQEFKKSDQI